LSELAFAWIYDKPIIALTGHGGWSDALAGTVIDQRRTEKITTCKSVDELKVKVIEVAQNLSLTVRLE
jgi:hypothetical protein